MCKKINEIIIIVNKMIASTKKNKMVDIKNNTLKKINVVPKSRFEKIPQSGRLVFDVDQLRLAGVDDLLDDLL